MKTIPIRNINKSKETSSISENFDIRAIQTLLGGKDMVQELHRHDYYLILVIEKGNGRHTIDFTPYKINDHSIFFMRPGQLHQLTLKAESTGYLIQFKQESFWSKDNIAKQHLRKASTKNHYQLNTLSFKKIGSILTSIFQEQVDKQEGNQEIIKANLSILFIELIRQQSKNLSDNVNSYPQERLEEFLELLETRITTHKQVSDYASLLNLSSYQLNATTKSMLGKTCSILINEQIILESKRYLLTTLNQVNQIAYHMGYEDASYFIRFFKKHTGYSPEAFRQNFK